MINQDKQVKYFVENGNKIKNYLILKDHNNNN